MPHAFATIGSAAVLFVIQASMVMPAGLVASGLLLVMTYAAYLGLLVLFPEKRAYLLHNSGLLWERVAQRGAS
jgi:hypothetical protein